jgi:hypothetical protein
MRHHNCYGFPGNSRGELLLRHDTIVARPAAAMIVEEKPSGLPASPICRERTE